ncbi:hypothetical protein OHA72_10550 [Dactylosporangium sp. NBC_01737]|uniref:hypothetical protein n=1 Tax=Dactylosporangium sp. NBC_01737 TaxID=2975959 RepID=UPI002E0E7EE4|nr:hypothetical protein OHA72_10550 [Dactylosporangium sp. NBC_01737]
MHQLTFPLAAVLVLAEHAAAAHTNADPYFGDTTGPALLLAAADSIYLLSNGQPPLAAAAWQPQAHGSLVVYADGYGPGALPAAARAAAGLDEEILTGVPVPDAVLRRLRAAATDHDLFTLNLSVSHAILGVACRQPGSAAGAGGIRPEHEAR